jgi:hypothetical protein
MPDSVRERRLEELHSAALRRGASEWDEFLRLACGGNTQLRRAVESLLGYEQKLHGFLEAPPLQTATLDANRSGAVRGRSNAGALSPLWWPTPKSAPPLCRSQSSGAARLRFGFARVDRDRGPGNASRRLRARLSNPFEVTATVTEP